MSSEIKRLIHPLLELLVTLYSVTDNSDHFAQLVHDLLLLLSLYFHSQWSEGWDVFWGYVLQLLLYDAGREQEVKTQALSQTEQHILREIFWADPKYESQDWSGHSFKSSSFFTVFYHASSPQTAAMLQKCSPLPQPGSTVQQCQWVNLTNYLVALVIDSVLTARLTDCRDWLNIATSLTKQTSKLLSFRWHYL